MGRPVAPGAAVGNIEVVASCLWREVSTAISLDPVAVLALLPHKSSLTLLVHPCTWDSSNLSTFMTCLTVCNFSFLVSIYEVAALLAGCHDAGVMTSIADRAHPSVCTWEVR